jgi:hypothetical protein
VARASRPCSIAPGHEIAGEAALRNVSLSNGEKSLRTRRPEMKVVRILGIFLVGIYIASGLSSCCEINDYLASHNIGPDAPLETDPPLN